MLRDRLSKTSGWQFHRWLFGPEKFSRLSRNGPQAPSSLSALDLSCLQDQLQPEVTYDLGPVQVPCWGQFNKKVTLLVYTCSEPLILHSDAKMTSINIITSRFYKTPTSQVKRYTCKIGYVCNSIKGLQESDFYLYKRPTC